MRVRIRKFISTALCGFVLLFALCAPAFADPDAYYTGEVDAETGEAVTSSSESSSTRVRISDTTYYDREAHAFAYLTGSGIRELRSNVADGMVVTEPVSITADESTEVTIYRNGEALEGVDLTHIADVGSYTVSVRDVDSFQTLFGFTIVGAETNLPGGYVMPEGFYILDATLDGENAYYERNFIGMEDEGLYDIEYVCPDTSLHYRLTTTVDRTPPQLTLSGKLDKQGRYRSAVQVGGLEPGGAVALSRDGADVKFPSDGKLTEAGMYQLQAYDAAGNLSQKQFTILVYFDLNSLLFFALVCVSLAGVLIYILYKRKKLKIV